jgi:hypothetical protein
MTQTTGNMVFQPLERIFKKSIEKGSILRYGPEKYLEIYEKGCNG